MFKIDESRIPLNYSGAKPKEKGGNGADMLSSLIITPIAKKRVMPSILSPQQLRPELINPRQIMSQHQKFRGARLDGCKPSDLMSSNRREIRHRSSLENGQESLFKSFGIEHNISVIGKEIAAPNFQVRQSQEL